MSEATYGALELEEPEGGFVEVESGEQAVALLQQFNEEAGQYDPQAAYRMVEIPPIDAPPGLDFRLPGGYIDTDGMLHTDCSVRELTGADEEYIARAVGTNNYAKIVQAYLHCGVESIGGQTVNDTLLKMLSIGDRDYLILAIRRVTYGDEIKFDFICPACGAEHEVVYDLTKDVPIKTLDNPEQPTFTVELRHGRIATCTRPSGFDQDEIFKVNEQRNKKQAEIAAMQNTVLINRCVNNIDHERFTPEQAMAMGLSDRNTILTALRESQPGPDYNGVEFKCTACEEVTPVVLGLADLFRSN